MTFFTQSGDYFSPTPGRDSLLNALPVGNYVVVETMEGLKFQRVDKFKAPGRMYGTINQRAERILSTFEDRPRTTGVLLEGEKGSGKSQLARNISYMAYEKGIPTILINAPYCGDGFNKLLASIEQPAIVLMDEFEKVYDSRSAQEQVLTLLDGMMTSKKLFILTVNDRYRVNEHMHNRPGRIYYSIAFSGLEAEFIREYCEDNLKDQSQIENVLRVSSMFASFNFDMLKAIVEEMNRYNEDAFQAIEMLNTKPPVETSYTQFETFAVTGDGKRSEPKTTDSMPLMEPNYALHYRFVAADSDDQEALVASLKLDQDDEILLRPRAKNLQKLDASAGKFEFNIDGYTVYFERKAKEPAFDMRSVAF